jgi:hypothetical protein
MRALERGNEPSAVHAFVEEALQGMVRCRASSPRRKASIPSGPTAARSVVFTNPSTVVKFRMWFFVGAYVVLALGVVSRSL